MPDNWEKPSSRYNLQHEERTVKVYTVTESEIDNLSFLGTIGSVTLGGFTTFLGSSVAFALTSGLTMPHQLGILGVLALVAIIFLVLTVVMFRGTGSEKKRIKKRDQSQSSPQIISYMEDWTPYRPDVVRGPADQPDESSKDPFRRRSKY